MRNLGRFADGGLPKSFWIPLLVTVAPFVASPIAAAVLSSPTDELRSLGIGLVSAIAIVGLSMAALVIGLVSKRFNRQVGAGILVGVGVGVVVGSLTCGAVMYQAE